MAKWIYIVCTKCSDPSREKDFNEWYDTMHLPDLVKRVPGLMKATRYELAKVVPQGRTLPGMPKFAETGNSEVPKYLAIYELDTDNIDFTLSMISSESRKIGEEGRMCSLPIVIARYLYRQVSPKREKIKY
jgi:hypothetical protein